MKVECIFFIFFILYW